MPSLGGAAEWLNSAPLGPAKLRGHVVLVDFWTLTCINWLRQEPYVRAWSGLPERRVGGYRRPHAGVLVRARDRPRAAGDDGASGRLSGRGRQRLRDLERLRQPLLAGALLRRRGGHHSRPPLRRGTLRAIGTRHPAAARRRARARLRRRARRGGGGRLGPPAHARDVSRLRAQRALHVTGRRRVRRTTLLPAPRPPARQPLGPRRRVNDRR